MHQSGFPFGTLSACVLSAAGMAMVLPGAGAQNSSPIKIGMARSLFVKSPRAEVDLSLERFGELVKDRTGLVARFFKAGDALALGKAVHDDKFQVGIFQGIEFAWAKQKYPDLRPLMIAVRKSALVQAKLVVAKKGGPATFAGLRGKDLALPRGVNVHCRLFLEKSCATAGQNDGWAFLAHLTQPGNSEDALDNVLEGTVQGAIVDGVAWEQYKDIKPGCYARLKVIGESEPFPSGVIAFRKGGLDKAALKKFRAGMLDAASSLKAREMMALVQITAFEPVPPEFNATLANIVKAYPAPTK